MTEHTPIDSQYLFKSLLEAMPLPVFVVDTSMMLHYYNQSAVRLFETTTLSQSMQLEQAIHDPGIIQLVQESIHQGKALKGRYDRGSSDIGWRVSVSPLALEAASEEPAQDKLEYQYFAVIIEDMAEVRRLEGVQRDFLANISHELRTPLSSVRLLAETLEDAIDTNPDQAQVFVEKIEVEVQYLTGLVSELLELSRIESGQLPMTMEPVEAELLVHEVMARMLPLAQRHRIIIRTDIQQGKTFVVADSKQIVRVLVNLVHNAIKFTPSGGTVVIGTAPQAEQHVQQFFVRDTGVGIRAEELPRIFERFYKTDRARSKADFIGPGGGGTGLGLAIARRVVETHGGRITAESIVGTGSSFTFTLPVAIRSKE